MKLLDKLSKREKIGLIIGVIVVCCSMVDRLVLAPISRKIEWLNNTIHIEEKRLAKNLRNLRQEEVVSKAYQKYIPYMKGQTTDEEELAKILSEIEEYARSSRVYLVDMKPQTPLDMGFYKKYLVEIEVESEIEPFIEFLYQLSVSKSLLRAEKLRIKKKGKTTGILRIIMLVTRVVIP